MTPTPPPPTSADAPEGTAGPRMSVRQALMTATRFVGTLATVGTGCGLAASTGWPLELASHFVAIYAAGFVVALPLALVRRERGRLVVYLVGLALCLVDLRPLYVARPTLPAGGRDLTILTVNVQQDWVDVPTLRAIIERESPDVIGLSEATPRLAEALAPIRAGYPHRLEAPEAGCLGLLLYSRLPGAFTMKSHGAVPAPYIQGHLEIDGDTRMAFRLVHVWPPVSPRMKRVRDQQLSQVADQLREQDAPAVMFGDMNLSPFSPDFRTLLARSGLAYTGRGFGFRPTWPTLVPIFWTQIDHVLASPGLGVRDHRALESVGSDHLPLLVTLVVPRPPGAQSPPSPEPGG